MLFTGLKHFGGGLHAVMILTCPACDTKYVVKDGAIPPGGRQVRCAACKHSWHQDPEVGDEEQTIAEAAMIEPSSGPEAEALAYTAAMADAEPAGPVADDRNVAAAPTETVGESEPAPPPERDDWVPAPVAADPPAEQVPADEFEPFYDYEPAEPRKRGVPLLVWLALLVAVIAAAIWFLAPPELRERLGIAGIDDTPLEVMVTNSDRQKLASGNELFAVSGRVINPTDRSQRVPPLRAELLDASKQRVVYSWTIAPPAATLGPGGSASFNSAEVDVPEGGSHLRVTLGDPAA